MFNFSAGINVNMIDMLKKYILRYIEKDVRKF